MNIQKYMAVLEHVARMRRPKPVPVPVSLLSSRQPPMSRVELAGHLLIMDTQGQQPEGMHPFVEWDADAGTITVIKGVLWLELARERQQKMLKVLPDYAPS